MSESGYERWLWETCTVNEEGDPLYDSKAIKYSGDDMSDVNKAARYKQDCEEVRILRLEIEALRGLLGANARVIKEELRKELDANTNIS